MDRVQIMLMSSRELQIRAAGLDGWTDVIVTWQPGESSKRLYGICPHTRFRVVPNYSNDTTAAMGLWDQIDEPKEITWEDGYICLSWDELPEAWIKAKIIGPDTFPDLLTRAYVWAKTP